MEGMFVSVSGLCQEEETTMATFLTRGEDLHLDFRKGGREGGREGRRDRGSI